MSSAVPYAHALPWLLKSPRYLALQLCLLLPVPVPTFCSQLMLCCRALLLLQALALPQQLGTPLASPLRQSRFALVPAGCWHCLLCPALLPLKAPPLPHLLGMRSAMPQALALPQLPGLLRFLIPPRRLPLPVLVLACGSAPACANAAALACSLQLGPAASAFDIAHCLSPLPLPAIPGTSHEPAPAPTPEPIPSPTAEPPPAPNCLLP